MEPEGKEVILIDDDDEMMGQQPIEYNYAPVESQLYQIDLKEEDDEEYIKPFLLKDSENGARQFVGWRDMLLKENTVKGLFAAGYKFPSQIQAKAIPVISNSANKKDYLCSAHSGMGKTGIFLVTLLELMKPGAGNAFKPHQSIIIGNTRELAHQIYKELRKIGQFYTSPQLRFSAYIGGTTFVENSQNLKDPNTAPHILVCTLGRLTHLLEYKYIAIQNIDFVVIDQCDNFMSDFDSRVQIQNIMTKIKPQRRLFMFTATLNPLTRQECIKLMKPQHELIQLNQDKDVLQNIKHYYVKVRDANKFAQLELLLTRLPFNQVLIFGNTVERVMTIHKVLQSKLFKPMVIHSAMEQIQRLQAHDKFKIGDSRIMVATDISGRGIDFEKVDYVVNFDFPYDVEQYQHRAARTGRFGKKGRSINFIDDRFREEELMHTFEAMLKIYFRSLPQEILLND